MGPQPNRSEVPSPRGTLSRDEYIDEGAAPMRIAIVEDEAVYADKLHDYLARYARDFGQALDVSYFADAITFVF